MHTHFASEPKPEEFATAGDIFRNFAANYQRGIEAIASGRHPLSEQAARRAETVKAAADEPQLPLAWRTF
jgi:hypothetical protein